MRALINVSLLALLLALLVLLLVLLLALLVLMHNCQGKNKLTKQLVL